MSGFKITLYTRANSNVNTWHGVYFREMAKLYLNLLILQACNFHIMQNLWHTMDLRDALWGVTIFPTHCFLCTARLGKPKIVPVSFCRTFPYFLLEKTKTYWVLIDQLLHPSITQEWSYNEAKIKKVYIYIYILFEQSYVVIYILNI